jgi:hypothetical protein
MQEHARPERKRRLVRTGLQRRGQPRQAGDGQKQQGVRQKKQVAETGEKQFQVGRFQGRLRLFRMGNDGAMPVEHTGLSRHADPLVILFSPA